MRTESVHHAHDHAQEATANKVFGFWLYLMTDCILFATVFAAFAVGRDQFNGGPTGKDLFALNGVIYATTHCDGDYGAGSIYELTRSGASWTYTALYNFTGGGDGLYSISNLVLKGGKLYGTTIGGGQNGAGTVYAFKP